MARQSLAALGDSNEMETIVLPTLEQIEFARLNARIFCVLPGNGS